MKKLLTTIVCLILLMGTSMMNARPPMYTSTNTEVPSKLVKNEHGSWQLIVNGKPFIMLAGELHNSSASTTEYLNSLWTPLKTLNLNTVLAPIAWEQFEPQEGIFDYTLINNMIDGARKNGFKLSILWFGSWKNGESSYAPTWVKEDTKRFFRVKNVEGKEIETLSPFCENAMKADAKAFKTLVVELGYGNMDLVSMVTQAQKVKVDAVILESHKNWVDNSPLKSMELSAEFMNQYVC